MPISEELEHDDELYRISQEDFKKVTEILGIPKYLNKSLYHKVIHYGPDKFQFGFRQFAKCWKAIHSDKCDYTALIFAIICQEDRNHVVESDLELIAQDVVERHPGLEFLKSAAIFQCRYGLLFF
jgi:hypothetical protein